MGGLCNYNALLFKTDVGNRYIYDRCSNLVFYGRDAFVDVLRNYSRLSKEEIIKQFGKKYGEGEVGNIFLYIDLLYKNYGCFYKPFAIKAELTKRDFENELLNLGQIIFEITQRCNFRCKYCIFSGKYQHYRKHSNASMIFDVAKGVIDYLFKKLELERKTRRKDEITFGFYGGEPLIEYQRIKQCIEYIKKRCMTAKIKPKYLVTTNGYLLNNEILKYFIDNDVRMNISLDGPKEIHDKNRILINGEKTFSVVWRNIENIIKIDSKYYKNNIGYLITLTGESDLYKTRHFFESSDYFSENIIQINFVNQEAPSSLKYERTADFINAHNSFLKEYDDFYLTGKRKKISSFLSSYASSRYSKYTNNCFYRPYSKIPMSTGTCVPGTYRLYVSTNGTFHICEKINGNFSIGDYKKGVEYQKVKRIWNLYFKSIGENCEKCPAIHDCPICFASAAQDSNFCADSKCQLAAEDFSRLLERSYSLLEKNSSLLVD